MTKTILFVCSANKQRSKTAEDYFSEQYPQINFISAGTNIKICQKEGTNSILDIELEKVDIIYVMEKKHKNFINSITESKYSKSIKVLNIPDIYKYYQKELLIILKEKINIVNI